MTTRVTLDVPVAEREGLVQQILVTAAREPKLTARPVAVLRRAIASGRLVIASDTGQIRGWFLSEPGGAHEIGFVWVHPEERDGAIFERMLALLTALEPVAVAVTFRPAFAQWLVRSHGFRRSSLTEVTRLTSGAFLWRRFNPRRLAAAAGHGTGGAPVYLVREEAGA